MQGSDSSKEEIILCLPCGNETLMKKVGEYTWGSRNLEFSEINFFTCMNFLPVRFATRLHCVKHTVMNQ